LLLESDAKIKRYQEMKQGKTLRQASLNKKLTHSVTLSKGEF